MLLFARARHTLQGMKLPEPNVKKAPSRRRSPALKAVAKHSKPRKGAGAANPFPFPLDRVDAAQAAPTATPQQARALDMAAGLRLEARGLFWSGWRLTHISEHLKIPRTTLYGWHKADGWDEAAPTQRVEGTIEARLIKLINKEKKTGEDCREIDLLGRQIERLARIHKYEKSGRESDLNPNIDARNAGPKKKPTKNFLSPEDVQKLKEAFLASLYDYQHVWWDNIGERVRQILKSRQIGATWYFAREALIDALETGRNQIFLSASRSQAYVFRHYITAFVKEVTGVTLTGDPITLANGATLYFLGTNSKTAQSYHGNLYFDEYFWTNNFTELNNVASGMSSHKKWHLTYFSTPSSIQHQAHALWDGSHMQDRNIKIDISHAALADGARGADGIWRHIVTVEDAERGGCDLFDIAELKRTKAEDVFNNLYMCHFIDDALAVFPLSVLQRCMVDSWDAWRKDFKAFAQRPFGHKRVWAGYDPSLNGDKAALVVLAPPEKPGGKFRILYKQQLHGVDFEVQAATIKKVCDSYNVEKMTIDNNGMGYGVYELVKKFFPAVRGIRYTPESKTMLVLKAQAVMRAGRLEFDAGDKDLAAAFMAVKREMTASGRSVTYTAGRSSETGHGDLAWATMHALSHEPLEEGTGLATTQTKSFFEVSE
ncbi:terminase [Comamonas thiooxydans]|uniref:Terminase n=2 Tax=Comamonas thiooxydans TaxID=363952 RepID=A0A0E3BYA8_9BURK|nr:terminase [Comamonas thiooxydans]KGH12158.1 terminase [Comamonas thiooxydans]